MHPLRHPRNAAFVGIIFIVIAVIYWAEPLLRRRARRLRGHDDAPGPRDRDVADGVRPGRRLVERLIADSD
jgi:hypothetical protein